MPIRGVRLLGPAELVTADGGVLPVPGTRIVALLARLAVEAGRVVPVTALVDAVWGSEPPADTANALQSLVSRLRRAAGDPAVVQGAPNGYRLAVDPDDVDLLAVEAGLATGRTASAAGDHRTALDRFDDALLCPRGAVSDGVPADVADRAATVLADLAAGRAEALLGLGRAVETVAGLEARVREAPLDERAAELLMRALAASGRAADALRVYDDLRVRLADELGADPSPALGALHVQILRGDGGPAAPPGRRTGNLRAALTSFVGRDDDLARLRSALAEHRLVTVLGPGGAGKTRLAHHVAAAIAEDPASPVADVWFVELAPVTDPVEVPHAVLAALGRRDLLLVDARRGPREVSDTLVASLADRPTLLVLDNCEHLLDPIADLVELVTSRCPGLTVLTTSREPVAVGGEALVPIAPLDVPAEGADVATAVASPAVALFADRARLARPDFAVTTSNVAAVVEIVRRLDGLPLALELAAAKLRVMPVATIAARLTDRFALLTGASRTATARHRTLRAVVEWSWDLMTPAERELAERLAVFAGSISIEAATAVAARGAMPNTGAASNGAASNGAASNGAPRAGATGDVADGIAALVDKSLLTLTGAGRYRMLETIREFGVERLASRGDLVAARAAHAGWFAGLAARADAELRGPEQLPWLGALEDDHDNLLLALRFLVDRGDAAALTLALDLAWYWSVVGRHGEAVAWLRAVVTAADDPAAGELVLARAVLALNEAIENETRPGARDEADGVRARLDRLAVELRQVAVPGRERLLAVMVPMLHFLAQDEAASVADLEAGMRSDDDWIRATSLAIGARAEENAGRIDTMRSHLDEAMALLEQVGDRWQQASLTTMVAELRMFDGDLAGAEEALLQARSSAELFGYIDVDDQLFVLLRLTEIRLRRGDLDGAVRAARDALALTDRGVGPEMTAMTLVASARVDLEGGDLAAAADRLDAAEGGLRAADAGWFGSAHGHAMVAATRAVLLARTGDDVGAAAAARAALDAGRDSHDMPILAAVAVATAQVHASRSDWPAAAQAVGAADVIRGAADPTDLAVVEVVRDGRAALGARFDRIVAAQAQRPRAELVEGDWLEPTTAQLRRR